MKSIVSIVIPTYGRDAVLVDSIQYLLALHEPADDLLVVDQTPKHEPETEAVLSGWNAQGQIRWIRHEPPGVVVAMNRGLHEAKGDVVLFLDDDIIPHENLVARHRQAYEEHPEAWAVVGQVIQGENAETLKRWKAEMGKDRRPQTADRRQNENENREFSELCELRDEPQKAHPPSLQLRRTWKDTEGEAAGAILKPSESNSFNSPNSRFKNPLLCILRILRLPCYFLSSSFLTQDLDFPFNGTAPAWVENVMAGNLSVRRERFLQLGGFDENFTPPVAYRFETEFAKRLVAAGGRIRFEPKASILHLRAPSGGTRSRGSHLASGSPIHGVGDYYYVLRCGQGWQRLRYILRRPFREVCTKFHLRHPWWIPVKFVGELRAIWAAGRLYRKGPKLLHESNRRK